MANQTIQKWWLFTGQGGPRPDATFPPAPPWRIFDPEPPAHPWQIQVPDTHAYWNRARTYQVDPAVIGAVNAALLLRRPLLVTGSPGAGKSSLIYRVAYELGLGPVFEWPVNSRSRLKDALYEYDALGRLQEHQLDSKNTLEVGRYITLQALGTALLPATRPRALLIDEIDKADPDLPNDLLNQFEEGRFEIPELVREKALSAQVRPMMPLHVQAAPSHTAKNPESVAVSGGKIRCHEFPFVVLTSNGEREFPPAFLRRCIRVNLPDPGVDQLTRIVTAHFGATVASQAADRIKRFAEEQAPTRAMDQFLNALFLVHAKTGMSEEVRKQMEDILTQPIRKN